MQSIEKIKDILRTSLMLGERINHFTEKTPLLGSLPELDSMGIVHVVSSLEEQFDIVIHDDELTAQVFETLGTLSAFIDGKLNP